MLGGWDQGAQVWMSDVVDVAAGPRSWELVAKVTCRGRSLFGGEVKAL